MSKIKITLACAYCLGAVAVPVGDLSLTHNGRPARADKIGSVTCPHCDSAFELHVTTKRKRQGKRYRGIVAQREAAHRAKVEAAKERNGLIANALLQHTGCTCGKLIDSESLLWNGSEPSAAYRARVAEYGHAFPTRGMSYGIPDVPRHERRCPVRDTKIEAETLDYFTKTFEPAVKGAA